MPNTKFKSYLFGVALSVLAFTALPLYAQTVDDSDLYYELNAAEIEMGQAYQELQEAQQRYQSASGRNKRGAENILEAAEARFEEKQAIYDRIETSVLAQYSVPLPEVSASQEPLNGGQGNVDTTQQEAAMEGLKRVDKGMSDLQKAANAMLKPVSSNPSNPPSSNGGNLNENTGASRVSPEVVKQIDEIGKNVNDIAKAADGVSGSNNNISMESNGGQSVTPSSAGAESSRTMEDILKDTEIADTTKAMVLARHIDKATDDAMKAKKQGDQAAYIEAVIRGDELSRALDTVTSGEAGRFVPMTPEEREISRQRAEELYARTAGNNSNAAADGVSGSNNNTSTGSNEGQSVTPSGAGVEGSRTMEDILKDTEIADTTKAMVLARHIDKATDDAMKAKKQGDQAAYIEAVIRGDELSRALDTVTSGEAGRFVPMTPEEREISRQRAEELYARTAGNNSNTAADGVSGSNNNTSNRQLSPVALNQAEEAVADARQELADAEEALEANRNKGKGKRPYIQAVAQARENLEQAEAELADVQATYETLEGQSGQQARSPDDFQYNAQDEQQRQATRNAARSPDDFQYNEQDERARQKRIDQIRSPDDFQYNAQDARQLEEDSRGNTKNNGLRLKTGAGPQLRYFGDGS